MTDTNKASSEEDEECKASENLLLRQRIELSQDDPELLMTMHNMAFLYHDLGRNEKALSLYKECLAGRRTVFSEDHPEVINTMQHLAHLYQSCGKNSEAQQLMSQCLNIERRVLSAEDPDLLATINNLAILYKTMGRFEESKTLYMEMLAMKRIKRRRSVIAVDHKQSSTAPEKYGRRDSIKNFVRGVSC